VDVSLQRANRVLVLFELYHKRIYSFARQSLPSLQAEDIVQEVFLRLLEHPGLDALEVSASYLIKIADNLIKRNYLRSKRFKQIRDESANWEPIEYENGPSRPGFPSHRDALDSAMDRLNDHEREAVRFIICEGLTYQDAARSLGVPVTTVNNWKHRGVQKLRSATGVPA
jgi:RNA polymerase sigma factor (sigma-70 family)